MIIYGTRSTQVAKEYVADKCPNCGTFNSIEMYVFQKYAHIYRIPVFPIGKTAVSQCDHCKQVLEKKQMTPDLLMAYNNIKQHSKTPVWTFSGAALLIILIGFAAVANKKHNEETARWILTPQNGDIYEYKTEDNQYTLLMVNDVQGDSVFIRQNQYETNMQKGLRKLKNKGSVAYSSELYAFSKGELKAMFDKGSILNIDRDK